VIEKVEWKQQDFASLMLSGCLMEIKQLRCFLAVAECLHFGHAAEKVFLSQPALSLQIRALEEEIGVSLFERNRHKTRLTSAGLVLVEDAQRILDLAQQAADHARQATLGIVGTVNVGFISTAAALIVPPVAKKFCKSYPGVSLELRNVLTEDQVKALQERRLDIGLLRIPVNAPPEIQTTLVHREPFVLLVPSEHPLADGRAFALEDLRNEDFVMYTRKLAAGFHDRILGILNAAGFSPRIVQSASEMYTLLSLVASGQGIAIAPVSVLLHKTTGVVARDLPDNIEQSEIAMAVNTLHITPATQRFADMVIEWSAAQHAVPALP
jgi:DNA-binding transcriptional LysR family regulator